METKFRLYAHLYALCINWVRFCETQGLFLKVAWCDRGHTALALLHGVVSSTFASGTCRVSRWQCGRLHHCCAGRQCPALGSGHCAFLPQPTFLAQANGHSTQVHVKMWTLIIKIVFCKYINLSAHNLIQIYTDTIYIDIKCITEQDQAKKHLVSGLTPAFFRPLYHHWKQNHAPVCSSVQDET